MSDVIEGRDFVIENGNFVFTADFLKRRGHCCGSGCRNCPYSFPNDKKVVSLVPSWTDTLLRCGVTVIGRTRFCCHPTEQVQKIPDVGGTKQCDFELTNALNADVIVLDKEENAKAFVKFLDAPTITTHVKCIPSMISGMIEINRELKNQNINQLIKEASALQPLLPDSLSIEKLPGVILWIKKPVTKVRKIVYLIWKDPWMAVSRHTFIGSVIEFLGYGGLLPGFDQDYPTVALSDFDRETTLFLFSSEPYPFAKKVALIHDLDVNAAVVDGERYGWFGLKAIEFLRGV